MKVNMEDMQKGDIKMTNKYITIEKFIFPKEGGVEHTALKFLVFNKKSGKEFGQHKSKKLAEVCVERLLATGEKERS